MPILLRPDGRELAYEVIGDRRDPVVFSIHGTPGSRVGLHPAVPGGCLIAFDRPGYGGSDPQTGRDVAAIAGEVEALADELGVGRFAVFGVSGGGPHALACAALLGDRVTRVASLVGVAPADALGSRAATDDLADGWTAGMSESNIAEFAAAAEGRDALAQFLAPVAEQVAENPEAIADQLAEELLPADVAWLGEASNRAHLVASMVEGLGLGLDGWIDDDLAFVTAWGFDPATITVPTLIWHGRDDILVPVAHAHALGSAIAGAQLVTEPGQGHLAAFTVVPSVVTWLTSDRPFYS